MIFGKMCVETMRLNALTSLLDVRSTRGPLDVDITGLAYDSRQVKKNFLFVALPGMRENGTRYIEDALRRGAVAIVSEEDQWPRRDVAHIHVQDARRALALLSNGFYNRPSERIGLIGITGTNGKTTTSFMCREILKRAGRSPGLIGTVRYELGERVIPASRTTPEAPDIQFMLDTMIRSGCRSAVMEVSSHALVQHRVHGTGFDVAIFTNLTRDHLDYHGSMEAYFDAKARLFSGLGQWGKPATAILNIDDSYGRTLADALPSTAGVLTYGLAEGTDFRATGIRSSIQGTRFQLSATGITSDVFIPVYGLYNVSNALAALAACHALGVDLAVAIQALAGMPQVPGRLERVVNERGIYALVDYAHTEDALAQMLGTLREIGGRKLITVFGCGGDRDREKRPAMGAVAARLADRVIVTSDNPRSESPTSIIESVLMGAGGASHVEAVVDREAAIARAVAIAQPGDIVVVAGKGHETYQEIGKTVIPFDDREVLARLLRA